MYASKEFLLALKTSKSFTSSTIYILLYISLFTTWATQEIGKYNVLKQSQSKQTSKTDYFMCQHLQNLQINIFQTINKIFTTAYIGKCL